MYNLYVLRISLKLRNDDEFPKYKATIINMLLFMYIKMH